MENKITTKRISFKASRVFVTLFYTIVFAWTFISVPLLISKASQISTAWLGMMGFIIIITWYWSLGITYEIVLEHDDIVRLKSLRRELTFHLSDFRKIEGPPSRIEFGFIRFRVARETIYAFFNTSESLKRILSTIKRKSTKTLFIKFSSGYFNNSLS